MTATSNLTGKKINRFTHLHQSTDDLIKKVKMQRLLGQKTASLLPALRRHGRFERRITPPPMRSTRLAAPSTTRTSSSSWTDVQDNDLAVDGAMTDVKGDRCLVSVQAG